MVSIVVYSRSGSQCRDVTFPIYILSEYYMLMIEQCVGYFVID